MTSFCCRSNRQIWFDRVIFSRSHQTLHHFFLCQWCMHSFIHSVIHSIIHSFIYSFITSLIRSFIHSYTIQLFIHSPQARPVQGATTWHRWMERQHGRFINLMSASVNPLSFCPSSLLSLASAFTPSHPLSNSPFFLVAFLRCWKGESTFKRLFRRIRIRSVTCVCLFIYSLLLLLLFCLFIYLCVPVRLCVCDS